ncbi:MAG TPA: MlaD family protein [Pseudolabrys sp.]|jgi:phospholipid/cholesterol/gamma-HCH transport system substrate-binding protein|nr:MlaD family protein [Pseudolabrys sp.]
MEDRAKYVLIGLFTFAVIAGAFGFVYWLHATSSTKDSASYRVIFSGSVTGLRTGAPVLFNGIRVGEVSSLALTDNPAEVAAILSVSPKTPVRADTQVTLDYAGLTGIASVSMRGNLATAEPLKADNGEMPTLRAQSASGDMSSAARETLAHVDAILTQNQESLHKSIKNIETFTDTLAHNSDNIDRILKTGAETVSSVKQLADNLDKRTADITAGVLQVTDSANKQINIVGGDAHRAIQHIDTAVSDLAKHPSRILFGGGQ